jgi:hypothetical protein
LISSIPEERDLIEKKDAARFENPEEIKGVAAMWQIGTFFRIDL